MVTATALLEVFPKNPMMSAALFFDARFFTLTDDDVFWVLRPLHAFLSSQDADTKINTAFALFDYNGDGVLSKGEMTRFLRSQFTIMARAFFLRSAIISH